MTTEPRTPEHPESGGDQCVGSPVPASSLILTKAERKMGQGRELEEEEEEVEEEEEEKRKPREDMIVTRPSVTKPQGPRTFCVL